MWYINSRVLNGVEFKNEFIISLRIPSDPNKGVASRARGGRGAETYIQQKIMWYIKSGVFNSRDFKNEISFPFRIPSDPNKGVAGGAWGGKGLLIPIHNKRQWNISILVFPIAGISKMRSVFLLGYTQDPNKGVTRGALGGGLRPIHNIR